LKKKERTMLDKSSTNDKGPRGLNSSKMKYRTRKTPWQTTIRTNGLGEKKARRSYSYVSLDKKGDELFP